MTVLAREFVNDPVPWTLTLFMVFTVSYVIYQRFLHPLAKYPGPLVASFTDLWTVKEYISLQQPYHLLDLHEKHDSTVVRYGPDKVSITDEEVIHLIYQKGSRLLPKTEFYDAFGGVHPNVFGMRDEGLHSIRRRHMSHSFSISYVKEMEHCLDTNIKIMKEKIEGHVRDNAIFDLKKMLQYYVIDVLGELAFSQSFGLQESNDKSRVPPVIEHSLLAAVTGAWPAMTKTLKKYLPYVPYEPLQKLFAGRKACAELASRCVRKKLKEIDSGEIDVEDRKDLLTNLIKAKHPDTGEKLTQTDLETEAFGFIIAGTHTTSATTTLLFYHLLHNPETMTKLQAELISNLPTLEPNQAAYSITVAESSLPYLRDCIRENFRLTPVFTMPLARRVTAPEGITIANNHFPQGTSVAVCNHAFHHNAAVWGTDHMVFDPARWEDTDYAMKSRLLMHFGLGGRQCLGKTVAMANIYKVVSTLLSVFDFELADEKERRDVNNGEYRDKIPDMISVGISDLKGPLMVRARARVSDRH